MDTNIVTDESDYSNTDTDIGTVSNLPTVDTDNVTPVRNVKKRRRTAQSILRASMETHAPDIIRLFKDAILLGTVDGKEITTKTRTDLMKAFMPYVLPQLKSVEITNAEAKAIQPLIINMHGAGDVNVTPNEDGHGDDMDAIDGDYEEEYPDMEPLASAWANDAPSNIVVAEDGTRTLKEPGYISFDNFGVK